MRSEADAAAPPVALAGSREEAAPPGSGVFRSAPAWHRAATWLIHRLAWRGRLLEYALPLIEREAISSVRVPWWRKPGLWRRGFLSESAVFYDLDPERRAAYVSDVERCYGLRRINGSRAVLLDDKLLFDRLLSPFPELLPRLFGLLDGGRVRPQARQDGAGGGLDLVELLEREGRLIVKPASGGGGKGVTLLEAMGDGSYRISGRAATPDDLALHGRLDEGLMVTEQVDQHPAFRALYPRTTNTLRVITMLEEDGRAFIARAVCRAGSAASEPTDNWSRGGLCAGVDLESGRLGRAAAYPAGRDRLTWLTHHPDSGSRIDGVSVPNWREISRRLAEVAESLPFLPYVGWDVIPTEDGFKILEGNSYSNVNLLQIHGPLLEDPRVRAFLRRHRALRR